MNNIQKVIIIGAPRSGTNILRDVLTSFDDICTWPCDEINYIWRHGNAKYPSDELPAELATLKVKKFINKEFNDIALKNSAQVVIEKTCANSLRIPFVNSVIPDAKYIFIYRDGIDATGSAKERWTARLDIPYILEKVKFVPKSDLPYYALRYLWSRVYRVFSKDSRLGFWGPALNDMQHLLKKYSLNEICALQWKSCIENSERGLASISEERIVRIRYEDFVREPASEISRILNFIEIEQQEELVTEAVRKVSPRSLGKGRTSLGKEEVQKLERLVGNTLRHYGY